MNRRQFLVSTTGAAALAYAARVPDPKIKRVLVMFKCHLDVGFVDTQAAIIKRYFEQFFPQAIRLTAELREAGGDERYVWTTGSWLIYQYLEQANPEDRRRMEEALGRGDLAWHALPFTWQTELLDASAIEGCIGFSRSLDARFGKRTTGAKMTDVPGHTRGLIAPLANSGVTLLDIGVNSASTPPDVPDAFLWKDPNGASIVMLYHRKAYGGVIQIPKSDLAIAVEMRDDNSGPHTKEEIHQIYSELRQQFPSATIQAATLSDIAGAVEPFKANLPVVAAEIGDTWIYGVASDPAKLARIRELVRLRKSWVEQSKLKVADSTDLAFLAKFALAVEHTWGTDTKTWLDFDHYTPDDLAGKLDDPKYRTVTGSWVEKRNDIDDAVAGLPAELRAEAQKRLAGLQAVGAPNHSGLTEHSPAEPFTTTHFTIALDPATGAIADLRHKDRHWASTQHPLGLLSYQTLSKADYDKFLASYITVQTDWAPKDFGKPNIESFGAESRVWTPKLKACWAGHEGYGHRMIAHLQFESTEPLKTTAWPQDCHLDLLFSDNEPAFELHIKWFQKRANRMPEALWLTFNPAVFEAQNWSLTKVGQKVSPFEVVSGGNRHMHAVEKVSYQDRRGSFELEPLDAGLVSLGERSPIYFSKEQPDLSRGLHFSLFNNGWGTNYVQWFGEDMRFRFVLRLA